MKKVVEIAEECSMELVLVESPFAGWGQTEIERKACEQANIEYARKCLAHCLVRGEAPYASHLLYTQEGVLDDNIPQERKMGIEAGLQWGSMAKKTVVYIDRGFTKGMAKGLRRAFADNRPFELRTHPLYTRQSKILLAYYLYSGRRPDDPRRNPAYYQMNDDTHSTLLSASSEFDGDIVDFLLHLQDRYV